MPEIQVHIAPPDATTDDNDGGDNDDIMVSVIILSPEAQRSAQAMIPHNSSAADLVNGLIASLRGVAAAWSNHLLDIVNSQLVDSHGYATMTDIDQEGSAAYGQGSIPLSTEIVDGIDQGYQLNWGQPLRAIKLGDVTVPIEHIRVVLRAAHR